MTMDLRKIIYEELQNFCVATPEVYLEDVLRNSCGYRHMLQLRSAGGDPPPGPEILIQETSLRLRRVISNYLSGAYGASFQQGHYRTHGNITLTIDGVLDGSLVEVSVVSTREFNDSRPPRRSVLSAAVKAHLIGAPKALLIQFDRNSQKWNFWDVTGDFSGAATPVLHDLNYINRAVSGETDTCIAAADERTCRRCPFNSVCDAEKVLDSPPGYLLRGVKATPNKAALKKVEAYLWKLNTVDNGRRKKVLHPSSFSLQRCDREQAYDLKGIEELEQVSPKLRRIFDAGHVFHDLLQETLGAAIPDFQAETPVHHDEIRMYGHCDGEVQKVGLEIKSISDQGFDRLSSPKSEHKRQATIYGVGRGLGLIHYVYVNKETGELKVFSVKINRASWHKMVARAFNIIKTVDAGDLPPRIDSDYTCNQCKYAWECKPQRRTEVKRTF